MITSLSSKCSFIVDTTATPRITAWIIDPPRADTPKAVRQLRPGSEVFAAETDLQLHKLAAWIIQVSNNQGFAKKYARRFARDRLRREKSRIWSISVSAVRAWIHDRNQGKLWRNV